MLDRLAEEQLDFHIAAVCEFGRGDPRLLGDVEVALSLTASMPFWTSLITLTRNLFFRYASVLVRRERGGRDTRAVGKLIGGGEGREAQPPLEVRIARRRALPFGEPPRWAAVKCASTFSLNLAVLSGGGEVPRGGDRASERDTDREGKSKPAESGAKDWPCERPS